MLFSQPLDSRAWESLRDVGLNRINILWKRIDSDALALALLRRQGIAESLMKMCAARLFRNYGAWVHDLCRRASGESRTIRSRTVLTMATTVSRSFGDSYVGTEHLLLACFKLDESLLSSFHFNATNEFEMELRAYRAQESEEDITGRKADLSWPSWAPRRILRVKDFPPNMTENAQLIVESMSVFSKRELLQEPAIRYALSHHPNNLEQLRFRLVEYFTELSGGRGVKE